jgi:Excreted virulence factor EspC, type VII ESX diderm
MNPDLEVDTDHLRHTASALAAIASRVTGAAAHEPVGEATPRWLTTAAAALAADAARSHLAQIGADLADTAHRINKAAEEYASADARAAGRIGAAAEKHDPTGPSAAGSAGGVARKDDPAETKAGGNVSGVVEKHEPAAGRWRSVG